MQGKQDLNMVKIKNMNLLYEKKGLKMEKNNIDILKSDLLIVKQQYEELISYDKGFKDKQEL